MSIQPDNDINEISHDEEKKKAEQPTLSTLSINNQPSETLSFGFAQWMV